MNEDTRPKVINFNPKTSKEEERAKDLADARQKFLADATESIAPAVTACIITVNEDGRMYMRFMTDQTRLALVGLLEQAAHAMKSNFTPSGK